MSRFPKLTETFVLHEAVALQSRGVHIELFPLVRTQEQIVQPEALRLNASVRHLPFMSVAILKTQFYYLFRHPRRYASTLVAVIRGNWGSLNYLLGGIAVFPKVVHAARMMQQHRIQHVHCHFSSHPALAGFVIRRLTGIPFSFVAHGSDLHVDRHMLCDKANEASFVVAISKYNAEIIERECPAAAQKVHVIHCGVDTELYAPTARAERNGVFRIVCVGRLEPVKGQRHLVEACRLLFADGFDVQCELIGAGPEQVTLARLVDSYGLHDRVHFAGAQTREYVADALRDADVVVAPSVVTRDGRREGIPVVLMEALACGRAVIASDISGIPELVENERTGILVAPGDPAAIARAVRRLANDPDLRRRIGIAGQAKVEREFNLAVNADRLLTLINVSAQAESEHAGH